MWISFLMVSKIITLPSVKSVFLPIKCTTYRHWTGQRLCGDVYSSGPIILCNLQNISTFWSINHSHTFNYTVIQVELLQNLALKNNQITNLEIENRVVTAEREEKKLWDLQQNCETLVQWPSMQLGSRSSGLGSSPGQGTELFFFWAGHSTLLLPFFTQVFKWVPANLLLGRNRALD